MAGDENKSEKATPGRRKKAREEGQFARGRDAGAVAATLAVILVLGVSGEALLGEVREFMFRCLREPYDLVRGDPTAVFGRLFTVLSTVMLPTAMAAAVGGTAIGFLEAGFHPRLALAFPDFSRIAPMSRLKGLFKPRKAIMEIALATAKILLVGYMAYSVLKDAFPMFTRLARTDLQAASVGLVDVISSLAVRTSFGLALLAGLDYLQSRFTLEKQMMMSKHEIKEEHKQQEGDPRVKLRARAKARERMRRGLSKAVQAADVVLANPTHVSVALRYRQKDGAPIVTAKGYDDIAMFIRQLAREADIPIVENKLLARGLAARVKVGKPIPVDLYAAVAEVLAFVYRLRGRASFR